MSKPGKFFAVPVLLSVGYFIWLYSCVFVDYQFGEPNKISGLGAAAGFNVLVLITIVLTWVGAIFLYIKEQEKDK